MISSMFYTDRFTLDLLELPPLNANAVTRLV